MELPRGIAKADNPMYYEEVEPQSAQDDFLAWNAELSRVIKRLLPADFVKSSRPTEDDFAQEYSTATRTRQAVAACALFQKQWDECNCGLFEIVIDSISVDPTEERHIETTFGGESPDGQQLLNYILSHGDSTRHIRSNSSRS
eukprot:1304306-Prymnesium_polylepis.1